MRALLSPYMANLPHRSQSPLTPDIQGADHAAHLGPSPSVTTPSDGASRSPAVAVYKLTLTDLSSYPTSPTLHSTAL